VSWAVGASSQGGRDERESPPPASFVSGGPLAPTSQAPVLPPLYRSAIPLGEATVLPEAGTERNTMRFRTYRITAEEPDSR
jgi:hypothetical protein